MANDGINGAMQPEETVEELCAPISSILDLKYKNAGYSQETIKCIYEVLSDPRKYCFLKALDNVASSGKRNTPFLREPSTRYSRLNAYSAVDPEKVLDVTEDKLSEYFHAYKNAAILKEKIDAGELIKYFKDNDLIAFIPSDDEPETIAFTNNGINVFSEAFDIEHFVGFPAFITALENNSGLNPDIAHNAIYGKPGALSTIFDGIKV